MLTQFWQGFGGKLSERWIAAVFSPAFLFWAAVLAAWKWDSWRDVETWAKGLDSHSAVTQGLLLLGPLVLLALSGLLLQRLALPVLRLAEGYWPLWLSGLRERRRERLSRRIDANTARLRELSGRTLSARELAERAARDRRRFHAPADPARRMPTRVGNVLRAMESRVRSRYGLDPIVCWPQLWLVLPEQSRTEVTSARRSLYLAAQTLVVGLALLPAGLLHPLAALFGAALALGSYRRMIGAAETYAETVQACFDMHRVLLYTSLRLPAPADPVDERGKGVRLTAYLRAGSKDAELKFQPPS